MRMPVIAALVPVRVALDIDVARHDKEAVLDAHHFDFGAIQARQHRSGDDFVDRANHRRAGAEIEYAVDRVDQRIEFVGAEDDRDSQLVAQAARDVDDALLVGRVERDQRLVEQQQPRPAEQRLAQQQALALAPGETASTLADIGQDALALAHDEARRLRQFERGVDFHLRRVRLADAQIFLDRAREQHRLLKHHADVAAQRGDVHLVDVDAVDGHLDAQFLERRHDAGAGAFGNQ